MLGRGVPRILQWKELEGMDPGIFQKGGPTRGYGGGSPQRGPVANKGGQEADEKC